jgi:uncharacterized repeat protein (TIGR03806 family)
MQSESWLPCRLLAGAFFFLVFSSPSLHAAALPEGFSQTLIAHGLNGVTAMEIAPDGRIFICEQTGTLRVVKDGHLLPRPFVTVRVDSSWERGLLGIAFDPRFGENHFVYLNYVSANPYPHHVISRFTADGDVAVDKSEVTLFEGDDQNKLGGGVKNGHQGGAIHFGKDGKLYVAIGDQTAGDPAQNMNTLQGKILRLNPDGSIPRDNPFYKTAKGKYRAIWALGLRNPFTFAVQPGTGRILINDVGGANEEINEGFAGANYGWPTADHGPTTDPRFRGPIYWYPESSITGGAFYNPATRQFPKYYWGKYFFADFKLGWIKTLDPDDPFRPARASDFITGLGTWSVLDIKIAADGSLYYLRRNAWVRDQDFKPNTGALYKVRFTGDRTPPNISRDLPNQPVPLGGSATFRISATGTAPVRFQWQRGQADIPGAVSATYTVPAVRLADNGARFRCVVTNAFGTATSNTALLTVTNALNPNLNVSQKPDNLPALLSQTGVFASLTDLRPSPGVVPYDVNAPLWSDGASKRRWIVLPPGGKIRFAPTGEWDFPPGTVFIKHFELATDEEHPQVKKRLETRLLVVDGTGNGYGATYKWKGDNRDAELLATSLTEKVDIRTAKGSRTQTWYYPSRADCLTCHTSSAKFVLGVKTRQLNRDFTDPAAGMSANQLRTWNTLGMFLSRIDESKIPTLSRLAALDEAKAGLELRARSYLDANCANCHRPGNTIRAAFDARFDTPLKTQGILNAATVSDSLNVIDPKVVAPSDPARSMLVQRMRRSDNFKMPPLASNIHDESALAVLEQWIAGLSSAGGEKPAEGKQAPSLPDHPRRNP